MTGPMIVLTVDGSFLFCDLSKQAISLYLCLQFRFWTDSLFRIEPLGMVGEATPGTGDEWLTRLLLPGSSSVKSIMVFVGLGRF